MRSDAPLTCMREPLRCRQREIVDIYSLRSHRRVDLGQYMSLLWGLLFFPESETHCPSESGCRMANKRRVYGKPTGHIWRKDFHTGGVRSAPQQDYNKRVSQMKEREDTRDEKKMHRAGLHNATTILHLITVCPESSTLPQPLAHPELPLQAGAVSIHSADDIYAPIRPQRAP